MQKTVIENNVLGEKVIKAVHESGLNILVCEKKDFSSSFAIFGTKYGSIDTRFQKDGQSPITVPEGIAHFLEHKLFENEDCDAFVRFAKTGANANAYTSFDRTCYLFSCSDKFKDNLDILLDFVRSPYFTAETVKKEQGIIGQEIKMYDDVPDWCVFFNLIKSLYKNHPVKINIAGTVESISEITDELLYSCYNTFYNMSNMFLCIAGNVDADEILKTVQNTIPSSKPDGFTRLDFDETENIVTSYTEQKMAVSMPLFAFGIKLSPKENPTMRDILINEIALDVLVGSSSTLYRDLINEGFINKTFETEYFWGRGYSALLFQGQSKNPEKTAELIKSEIEALRNGIDKELFEVIKKDTLGKCITDWDNPEDIVSNLVDCVFVDGNPFAELEALEKITIDDIISCFKNINLELSALSVINPLE